MFFLNIPPQYTETDKQQERMALNEELKTQSITANDQILKAKDGFAIMQEEYFKKQKEIVKTINTPVSKENQTTDTLDCFIGNFHGQNFLAPKTDKEIREENKGYYSPKKELSIQEHFRSIARHQTDLSIDDLPALGAYSPKLDSIRIYIPKTTDLTSNDTHLTMLRTHNSIRELLTAAHEINHRIDHNAQNGNIHNLSHTYSAQYNTFTEKKSLAIEQLSLVSLYNNFHEKGITTINFKANVDGKETTITTPIENLLKIYPGLKETTDKYSTNLKDPRAVKEIIKSSCQFWDEHCKSKYKPQEKEQITLKLITQSDLSFSEQVKAVKAHKDYDYQDELYASITKEASKKCFLITGENLDLSPYTSLFDTAQGIECNQTIKKTKKDLQQKNLNTPDKELLAIDAYLESKGIKTDKEKDQYFTTQFQKIINRDTKADQELKNLMLGENSTIRYTDGLEETKIKGTSISYVSTPNGECYNIHTSIETFEHLSAKTTQSTKEFSENQTNSNPKTPQTLLNQHQNSR